MQHDSHVIWNGNSYSTAQTLHGAFMSHDNFEIQQFDWITRFPSMLTQHNQDVTDHTLSTRLVIIIIRRSALRPFVHVNVFSRLPFIRLLCAFWTHGTCLPILSAAIWIEIKAQQKIRFQLYHLCII